MKVHVWSAMVASLLAATSCGGGTPTGSFMVVSGMTLREGAVAVPLRDGRVLVAGGSVSLDGGAELEPVAELFDPKGAGGVGAFVRTGRMTTVRSSPRAVVLSDGTVLLFGGLNNYGPFLTSVGPYSLELFDPAGNDGAGTFSPVGNTSADRSNAAAVALSGARALFAGGGYAADHFSTALDSAELFDRSGNGGVGSFTATGPMSQRRIRPRAVLLADDRVLVGTDIFESHGGGVGTFTAVPLGLSPGASGGGLGPATDSSPTILPSGKVFFPPDYLGQAVLFDSAAAGGAGGFVGVGGSIGVGPAGFPEYPRETTPVRLPNGRVLVIGSSMEVSTVPFRQGRPLLFAETGNGDRGVWMTPGPMVTGRRGYVTAPLPGGRVLVAGGMHEQGIALQQLDSAEIYDPNDYAGTFAATASMPGPYYLQATPLLDGRVLFIGPSGAAVFELK